eukprot:jgi/Psemu1/13073/gm1.13073_g
MNFGIIFVPGHAWTKIATSGSNKRQQQAAATSGSNKRQQQAAATATIAPANGNNSNNSNNNGNNGRNSSERQQRAAAASDSRQRSNSNNKSAAATPARATTARSRTQSSTLIRHINSTHRSYTAILHSQQPTTIVGNSNSNRSATATAIEAQQQQQSLLTMETTTTNHCWQAIVVTTKSSARELTVTTTKQLSARAMKQKAKRKHGKTCRQRMPSNFLKNAAPALTSHETYNHLSKIKPKKKGRRSINANLKHVEQIALKKVNKNGFEGKFMETSWGCKTVGEKKYPLAEAVSIDSFKTLDSTNEKFILAFDKSEPSLLIVIGKWCVCFQKNVDPTKKVLLEETALHIVKEMQLCLIPLAKFVNLETTAMNEVVCRTTLKSIGHHATAFSIGKDYHSKCHIDQDMFYTRLTVIALTHVSDDKVTYYFVFPTYGIKVPLRSGDTLLFNPLVFHSCSNPRYKGCYIIHAWTKIVGPSQFLSANV